MNRIRQILTLLAALAAEIAAVALLHGLGSQPGLAASTLTQPGADPTEAVMAAGRLIALAAAWWLLATTVLGVAAALTRLPRSLRRLETLTPQPLRRLARQAVAATLSLSVLGAGAAVPARAQLEAPVALVAAPAVRDGIVIPPGALLVREGTPAEATGAAGLPPDPVVAGPPGGTPEAAAMREPEASQADAVHVVEPGDNLWDLAAARIAAVRPSGARPSVADVSAYWRALVEANHRRLRSGDPDVVYPGERLSLPAPEPAGGDG